MAPLLCLTKADLADPEALLSTYRSLGVPWVVTQRGGDLTEVARAAARADQRAASAHSGVGKSTLVNALVPDANREVGIVNAVTGRGRHTSTSAYMLALPDGDGWIIDTPGIRSFGLAHVQPEDLIEAFPDLDEMTEDCPRGCTHGTDEPECGLDDAVADGEADPERVESFRRLLAAREGAADWLSASPRRPGRRQSPVQEDQRPAAPIEPTTSSAIATQPSDAHLDVASTPRPEAERTRAAQRPGGEQAIGRRPATRCAAARPGPRGSSTSGSQLGARVEQRLAGLDGDDGRDRRRSATARRSASAAASATSARTRRRAPAARRAGRRSPPRARPAGAAADR